jgi:hypothetical protein
MRWKPQLNGKRLIFAEASDRGVCHEASSKYSPAPWDRSRPHTNRVASTVTASRGGWTPLQVIGSREGGTFAGVAY